jgi:hypothetical protein
LKHRPGARRDGILVARSGRISGANLCAYGSTGIGLKKAGKDGLFKVFPLNNTG